ncbi:MAG: hypothetical protein R3F17_02860 [Planctomycetota bacterium]
MLAFLLCAATFFGYSRTQERTPYQDGHPYDSAAYWHQAMLVAHGRPVYNWAPFVFRVGAPYAVGAWYPAAVRGIEALAPALLRLGARFGPKAAGHPKPDDLLDGYTWLNWFCTLAHLALLYFLMRGYGLRPAITWVLLSVYLANPNSPLRFSLYMPGFVDPAKFVFFFALWLGYQRLREPGPAGTALLCALAFFGALVRETVLLVPLAFLGVEVLRTLRERRLHLRRFAPHALILGYGVLGIVLAHHLVEALPVPDPKKAYHTLSHARQNFLRNWGQPEIYPLCYLTALGPLFLWMLMGLTTRPLRALLGRHLELPLFCVGFALLAPFAGNHTDRFIFWMLPACLVLVGYMAQGALALPAPGPRRVVFVALLIATQILAYRALVPIPAADFEYFSLPGKPSHLWLAPYGEGTNQGQMTAAFMQRGARYWLLGQFALLGLVLGALRYAPSRAANATAE